MDAGRRAAVRDARLSIGRSAPEQPKGHKVAYAPLPVRQVVIREAHLSGGRVWWGSVPCTIRPKRSLMTSLGARRGRRPDMWERVPIALT